MRRRRHERRRLAPLIEIAETEPVWHAWLLLTPGQRLVRAWRMRKYLKDPEAAHDERSLPRI